MPSPPVDLRAPGCIRLANHAPRSVCFHEKAGRVKGPASGGSPPPTLPYALVMGHFLGPVHLGVRVSLDAAISVPASLRAQQMHAVIRTRAGVGCSVGGPSPGLRPAIRPGPNAGGRTPRPSARGRGGGPPASSPPPSPPFVSRSSLLAGRSARRSASAPCLAPGVRGCGAHTARGGCVPAGRPPC